MTAGSAPPLDTNAHVLNTKTIPFICAAGAFLDGYDLLIINAALLLLVPAFHLTGHQTGLLTSVPFLAMVVGALVAGRVCDRIGRRKVFLIDVILFFFFSIVQALSQEAWQLFVMRALIGFAIGMDMPTGASMLAEFSPKGRLGRMTAMMQTMWVVGGMVAALVGLLIYTVGGPDAWRWMFASAAVPALLVAILRHQLPETPRWLATSGADFTTSNRPRVHEKAIRLLTDRRYRRPVLFFAIYWTVESFLGGPPFIYTALIFSTVIHLTGGQALLLSAVLAAVYVIVNLVAQYWALDQVGRKPVALLACGVAAVGAAATGLSENAGIVLVIVFGIFAVATQLAPAPFWPWSVEQLPTRIRATGQSVGSAGAKLGQFIGLNLFTAAAIKTIGWAPYFIGVGVGFALLTAFVAVFGRETRHVDIDDLDRTPAAASTLIPS